MKPEISVLNRQLVKAKAKAIIAELRIKEGGPTPQLLDEQERADGEVDTLKEFIDGYTDKPMSDSRLMQSAINLVIAKTGRTPMEITTILGSKTAPTAVQRSTGGLSATYKPVNSAPTGNMWQRCKEDYVFFCRTVLEIIWRPGLNKDKPDGGYGAFLVNEHQVKFVGVLIDLWLKGVPVRIILLKARQLGMTTAILAFWVWIMCQRSHFVVFFMIDKDPHMYEKRDMIIHWIESLEKMFPDEDVPTIEAKGGKRIVLSNGSKILFESAHSPNPGTSEMVHAIHLSEKPKWPKGRAALVDKSLLPGMPTAANTFVIDESTAQGMEEFYRKWDRVMKGKEEGLTKTTPIFLPWYLSPEYTAPVPNSVYDRDGNFKFLNEDDEVSETDELGQISVTEEQYAENYGLNHGQVYWRRTTIKNTYKGSRTDFDQEYPTTPDHAWAAFGTLFFGTKLATLALQSTEEPIFIGNLVDKNGNNDPSRLLSWTTYSPQVAPDRTGFLRIYERPKHGEEYFIGGDVAEGKQVESSSGLDPDYSTLVVCDITGKVVAVYRGRVKPEELALPVILLAIIYNQAWTNVERNSVGEATWAMFKQSGYPRCYARRGSGPWVDRAWNKTMPSNRHTMLVELRHHLRRNIEHVVDANLAHEISCFVTSKDGKPEAMSGEHDDLVMAYTHAWHMVYDRVGVRLEVVEPVPVKKPDDEWESLLGYHGIELGHVMEDFDPDDFTLKDIFFYP